VASPSTFSRLWPVLVADLSDPTAGDYLTGVALARGRAYLPLFSPPTAASTHVLEIYTPDSTEPVVLFADPVGPPNGDGFPLLLRMFDPEETIPRLPRAAAETQPESSSPASKLRPRGATTTLTLSERQKRELAGEDHDARPEALVGCEIAGGKLRIEAVIGSGGGGTVYRAAHRDLQISVAVKVLLRRFESDFEFCRRFHAEALAASRLDHPNIMRVLDFGQEPDGRLYLAMEHLDGTSLASILEPGTAIPLARIIDITSQICSGLAHAHARGIVHRDIKPANIVLVHNEDDDERPDEIVKVCDFGIAVKQADEIACSAVVGTPDYMSPEQCRGEALDGRSDVYSCGVMLYELATGRTPFSAPTPMAILNRHMHIAPLAPTIVRPTVDPGLEAIIMKALAKDPRDRQASMRDLRRELLGLLDDTGVPSYGPAVEGRIPVRPDGVRAGARPYESSQSVPASNGSAHDAKLAAELTERPAPWLSAFAESERQAHFLELARQLEGALPLLLANRRVKTLFTIRACLDELAADVTRQPGWRTAASQRLQRMFAEPGFLATLAEAALSEDEPPRETIELVRRVGGPAAYALYSARLRMSESFVVRRRFVTLVKTLGHEALPMIRAGLLRLETKRDVVVACELAADLLLASVGLRDEEAGSIASRYLHDSPPALTAVATEAIIGLWGPRATPWLLGLLNAEDDAVLTMAINGLRELRAIDERVVTRIAVIAHATRSTHVRSAVRAALLEPCASARASAAKALERLPSGAYRKHRDKEP
jgi:eukaryotic-like serine/threonine-protein kinase